MFNSAPTPQITVSSPQSRIRELWKVFERWQGGQRQAMEQEIGKLLTDIDKRNLEKPANHRSTPDELSQQKNQARRQTREVWSQKFYEEWQRRMAKEGLKDDAWGDMTADEYAVVDRLLLLSAEPVETPAMISALAPASVSAAQPQLVPPPQPIAPSLSTDSRTTNASSYSMVDPRQFKVDDEPTQDIKLALFEGESGSDLSISADWESELFGSHNVWSQEGTPQTSSHSSPSTSPEQLALDFVNVVRPASHASAGAKVSTTTTNASAVFKAAAVYKPESEYIGAILSPDPDEPRNEEAEYEKCKAEIRAKKIREFHNEAADAEIALSEQISALFGMSEKDHKEEVSRMLLEHQRRMVVLRKTKEDERKSELDIERKRLRKEAEERKENQEKTVRRVAAPSTNSTKIDIQADLAKLGEHGADAPKVPPGATSMPATPRDRKATLRAEFTPSSSIAGTPLHLSAELPARPASPYQAYLASKASHQSSSASQAANMSSASSSSRNSSSRPSPANPPKMISAASDGLDFFDYQQATMALVTVTAPVPTPAPAPVTIKHPQPQPRSALTAHSAHALSPTHAQIPPRDAAAFMAQHHERWMPSGDLGGALTPKPREPAQTKETPMKPPKPQTLSKRKNTPPVDPFPVEAPPPAPPSNNPLPASMYTSSSAAATMFTKKQQPAGAPTEPTAGASSSRTTLEQMRPKTTESFRLPASALPPAMSASSAAASASVATSVVPQAPAPAPAVPSISASTSTAQKNQAQPQIWMPSNTDTASKATTRPTVNTTRRSTAQAVPTIQSAHISQTPSLLDSHAQSASVSAAAKMQRRISEPVAPPSVSAFNFSSSASTAATGGTHTAGTTRLGKTPSSKSSKSKSSNAKTVTIEEVSDDESIYPGVEHLPSDAKYIMEPVTNDLNASSSMLDQLRETTSVTEDGKSSKRSSKAASETSSSGHSRHASSSKTAPTTASSSSSKKKHASSTSEEDGKHKRWAPPTRPDSFAMQPEFGLTGEGETDLDAWMNILNVGAEGAGASKGKGKNKAKQVDYNDPLARQANAFLSNLHHR